jgi:hypothetical protein
MKYTPINAAIVTAVHECGYKFHEEIVMHTMALNHTN